MASKQGSPVRDKAEWLLQFAVMSLVTPRDFRRLRREAHRWLDPDGARPLELGELRDVQAHIQRGLKALRRRQPWEHRVQGRHVLLSGAKGLHGPLSPRVETQGPSDRYVINAMDVLTAVGAPATLRLGQPATASATKMSNGTLRCGGLGTPWDNKTWPMAKATLKQREDP